MGRVIRPVILLVTVAALGCLAVGCAKPVAIKNASSLQLAGLLEARQTAARHQALAEEVFAAAWEIEREARVLREAVQVVDRLAPAGQSAEESSTPDPQSGGDSRGRCDPPIEDPSTAADCVATELFRLRQSQAAMDGQLTQPLQEITRVYSRAATALLDMLYRSHALIHEYIHTDIGPSPEQIQRIRSGLESLLRPDSQDGEE